MKRFLLASLAALAVASSSCRSVMSDEDKSDPVIKARIETALRGRKDLDLRYVTIDVNMGVATLSGIVPTSEQLRIIRRLAANMRGVEQVLNNLVVQE